MIVYIDLIFIINTVLTSALLFAVGKLLEFDYNYWRVIIAGVVGTLYTFLVILIQYYTIPGNLKILLQIVLNILIACLMIYIAYGKMNFNKFIKSVGYLYLLSFFAVGTGISVFYLYGVNPLRSKSVIFSLFVLVVIFFCGKFGYRLFKKYINTGEQILEVSISIFDKAISVQGFVDTGNRLKDPISGLPVIILEVKKMIPFCREMLKNKIQKWEGDFYVLLRAFENEERWKSRVRVLPFSDLGQEHGMLVGLVPDRVVINYEGGKLETKNLVIGLTERKLDSNNEFSALINSELF